MPRLSNIELARVRILLVDSAPDHVEFIRRALSQAVMIPFEVCWAGNLAGAYAQLPLENFDVDLLSECLADRSRLDSLPEMHQKCREIPVVVLKAMPDKTLTLQGGESGPLDFLVTGKVSAVGLIRSIRFALQRQQYMKAATQYFSELEAFGEQATAVEPASEAIESASLSNEIGFSTHSQASMSRTIRMPKQYAANALRDVIEQLRMVINAFGLIELHCRHRLGAEGIYLSNSPTTLSEYPATSTLCPH